MELEITWNRVIRVWWSYVWRNLIAILLAFIIGAVIGAIIGGIMGAMGFAGRTIQIVCKAIGAVIGLAISVVPMKLILGKDFGAFRLVLLSKQTSLEAKQSAGGNAAPPRASA